MKRLVFVASLLWSGVVFAQSWQGWSDNQDAGPFVLFSTDANLYPGTLRLGTPIGGWTTGNLSARVQANGNGTVEGYTATSDSTGVSSTVGYVASFDRDLRVGTTQYLSMELVGAGGAPPNPVSRALIEWVNGGGALPLEISSLGNNPMHLESGINVTRVSIEGAGDIRILGGNGLTTVGPDLPTNASAGFLDWNSGAGVPTGVPALYSSTATIPTYYDRADGRLYVYDPSGAGGWFPPAQRTDGHGVGCLQSDNSGLWTVTAAPCGTGSGSVTSVTGTSGQILCTPTSPNPVCSLVAAGTAGSCTNCSVTFDALGRETAQSSGPASVTSVAGIPGQTTSTGGSTPAVGLDTFGMGAGSCVGCSETIDAAGRVSAYSSVSYQAPIAGNTCGSNTFATSISTAGALTCTQPTFANLSGSATCAQRPAQTGDSTSPAGSCVTTNVALTETGGPASLVIGAIPSSFPDSTVLVRPGSPATIVGTSRASFLAGAGLQTAQLTYGLFAVSPATGWLYTNSLTSTGVFGTVEYGEGFTVAAARVIVFVQANTLLGTSPSVTFQVTRNGSAISSAAVTVLGSAVGTYYDSGTIAVAGASSSDTYGLEDIVGGTILSGQISCTMNVSLTR